jgi:ABC-type nitrate/sulfonate/bicarbonate transport system permease component
MIFWTAWAPIVLNTYNGLKRVDRSVIEAARLDGASGLSLLIHIYIPCAFPFIMTGFNISISSGWISIVAAEMLGGNNGLGFMVLQCSETFRYGQMYVAILTIAGIGLVMSSIIQKTQERFYSEESNVVLGFGFVGGNGIRERRER